MNEGLGRLQPRHLRCRRRSLGSGGGAACPRSRPSP
jgi:hypothetical protein